jgi:hypothetical protein
MSTYELLLLSVQLKCVEIDVKRNSTLSACIDVKSEPVFSAVTEVECVFLSKVLSIVFPLNVSFQKCYKMPILPRSLDGTSPYMFC